MKGILPPLCMLALISLGLAGCDSNELAEPSSVSVVAWWNTISAEHMRGASKQGTLVMTDHPHVDVKGLNLDRVIDQVGNPLVRNPHRFHAKSINGTVKGTFRTQGEGPGGFYGDARGDIVCVGVAPDGMSARIGGLITMEENNIPNFPDFTGTWAIWTVAVTEDGSPRTTGTSLGVPTEEIALAHCDNTLGFEPPLQETPGIVQIRTSDSSGL